MADCPNADNLKPGQTCAEDCDCPAAAKVMERLRRDWQERRTDAQS